MSVTRWTISDGVTTETFEQNPGAGGSPQYEKTFKEAGTLAVGGSPLLFEGQRALMTASVTGTILSAAQYNQFVRWYEKPGPLTLVDDLGRTMTIVISKFLPDRVYSATIFVKHTFTLNYYVLAVSDL